MCGIAGILAANENEVSIDRLTRMTDIIHHRGPDGEGHWISGDGHVGLGHRRLSIIDLSEQGNQPMHYMNRYTVVFNGEVYNYIELKEELLRQGFTFQSTSDTEVLMALYHRDRERCLERIDGMFAFALYDQVENTVFIARDRFGEKPFFYHYRKGKQFVFGSEMKALWAGGIAKGINNHMMYRYLLNNLLENPDDPYETFYENCLRLPPGHYMLVNVAQLTISVKRYYDIDYRKQNFQITEQQAAEKFRQLFYTSVERRLRSDVQVGTSLSGGLDSSAVVCTIDDMLKETHQKQKTFSAIFPGFAKDESRYIRMVIERTNVEPHFVTPDDDGMIRDLDRLIFHQEEPIGSASVYVQYCVMKLAKENGVTVLLDGQGADELLAGYHYYFNHFHQELRNNNNKAIATELAKYRQLRAESDKLHQVNTGLVSWMEQISPRFVHALRKTYHGVRSQRAGTIYTKEFLHYSKHSQNKKETFSSLNRALYLSTMKQGLHELLRYADRNSMAHSREVRLPFLNAELVEFVFTLPPEFKIKDAWTKWIMRKAFSGLLPEGICWRKDKVGYEPPQKSWMENKLFIQRVQAAREKLVKEGILKKDLLQKKVEAGGVGQIFNSSWQHFAAGSLYP